MHLNDFFKVIVNSGICEGLTLIHHLTTNSWQSPGNANYYE